MTPSLGLVIMICCIVVCYRYAQMENMSGLLWGVVSFLAWLLPCLLFHPTLLHLLLLQAVVLFVIRSLAMRQSYD